MRRRVALLLFAVCLTCADPTPVQGQERIVARFGAHDGYDRVVIDWPSGVDYDVDIDGQEITVRFARMAEIDVTPVARRLGARVSALRAATFPDGTALSFVLAPGMQLRHFRNGRSVVLDLVRKTAADIVDPASTRRLDQEKAGRQVTVPMPPVVSKLTPAAPTAAAPPASPFQPAPADAVAPPVPPPTPPSPSAPAPAPPPPPVDATVPQAIPAAPASAPQFTERPRTGAAAPLAAACAGDFETALARLAAMPPTALAPADMYNVAWLRRMLGEPASLTGVLPPSDAEAVGACSGRHIAGRTAELWRAFSGGRLHSEPILIIDLGPVVTPEPPASAPRPMQARPGGSPP